MSSKAMQRLFAAFVVLALVAGFAAPTQAQTGGPDTPLNLERVAVPQVDLSRVQDLMEKTGPTKVVVMLQDVPLVNYQAQALDQTGNAPAPAAMAAQLQRIESAQQSLAAQLTSSAIGAKVLYRVQRVYNGIAVKVDAEKLAEIAQLDGVSAIWPLATHTMDNAYAVPLIGAPTLWEGTGLGLTGDGISIGIIDTGIDYLHKNFGGPGTLEAYEAEAAASNEFTTDTAAFPTAKVVGGIDLVGDNYDANNPDLDSPVPDPNPMDCNGHGSHVAGSAAGLGVTNAGETFTGAYGTALVQTGTPQVEGLIDMRIGPGVAPQADLYAIRVFGCDGSTNVTDAAIEWAVDPNQDGDFSDHLDVINMSLGSPFGGSDSTDALAADMATLAGVIVVASSGNASDTTFVTGSPGTSTRTISVAATVDAYTQMDAFKVTAPAELLSSPPSKKVGNEPGFYPALFAANWPATLTQEVSGPLKPGPAGNEDGCRPFPENYFNGAVAFLDWTLPQRCGSAGRSANAVAAGASAVLMNYREPVLDITIAGSNAVPSAITTKTVGDAIKAQLAAGQTVNVTFNLAWAAVTYDLDPTINDMVSAFSSRGPRRTDYQIKPDIAAPGMTIFSTQTGRTFVVNEDTGALEIVYTAGDKGVTYNGTSMAAPMVAGSMALLRELHPTWTVEELKALAMNTAARVYLNPAPTTGDRGLTFSPARVGAGRIDLVAASQAEMIAYNISQPGSVSVTFGAPQIMEDLVETRVVRVVPVSNSGPSVTATPLTLSYQAVADNPGVEITFLDLLGNPLENNQLMLTSTGEALFQVQMTATVEELRNTIDPSELVLQEGLGRIYMPEESGVIVVSNTEIGSLVVPVYAAPTPASDMRGEGYVRVGPGSQTVSEIVLEGTPIDTTGGTFEGYPVEITSLVSAFELQLESQNETSSNGILNLADLKYVGVMTDYPYLAGDADPDTGFESAMIYFGVATQEQWSTPAEVEIDIYLDVNLDGVEDYVIYTGPLYSQGDYYDVHLANLVDLNAGEIVAQYYLNGDDGSGATTALFNTNVMMIPVGAADLGLDTGSARINYAVVTWQTTDGTGAVDATDWISYDVAQPGLDTINREADSLFAGLPIYPDLPGVTIPVHVNASADINSDGGVLLLHHHNRSGERAQVINFAERALPIFLPLLSGRTQ